MAYVIPQLCVTLDADRVLEMVEEGADPNVSTSTLWRPLHYAGMHDRVAVAKVLIGAKADLNARTAGGLSPLAMAVKYNREATGLVLMDAGADTRGVRVRTLPAWFRDRVCPPECKKSVVVLAGLLRRKRRYVARELVGTIARYAWETRTHAAWYRDAPTVVAWQP